ncbi:dUTP diphosphatase [uncultured Ilyobacter sp.]|uniref:dUTP diphosphatase n=1 Tax=uncultured Ilyobacter sp. TaxID=544433 RepID=UPI0029C6FAA1|nr:dUTP diphosphatase [uncultured Ilyobacter sp.]
MEKIEVKILREEEVTLPKYMTEGASGMDVCAYMDQPVILKPLGRELIPTGIKMEIPYGYEVQVRPRSGLAIKHGITLLNTPGTIDSDYRGEIKVIMVNLSSEDYEVQPGERIGQLVLQKVYQMKFSEVDSLEDTARSGGGFGHTGKK